MTKRRCFFFFLSFFLSTDCWYCQVNVDSRSLTFEELKVFLEVLINQMSVAAIVLWKTEENCVNFS